MSKRNREKRTSVRANIANYTSEKPLFGKYVGTIYRSEHERGIADRDAANKNQETIQLISPDSIYLAGKIYKGDWRHSIVKGLRNAFIGNCLEIDGVCAASPWPVLPGAVFGLDYTGPYFVSDDHGCFHGPDSHGFGVDSGGTCRDEDFFYHNSLNGGDRRLDVIRWCEDAINRSDIIFAWIEDTTCYGTLAEIGYAKALGKCIWIAGNDKTWMHTDLWFACNMGNELLFEEWLTPSIAIQIFMAKFSYTIGAIVNKLR